MQPPEASFCNRSVYRLLWLAFWLTLIGLVRCWNSGDVFIQKQVFFVDPDCYSRMTRVQRVYEHPGQPVHTHEFENWPEGTRPHTTAPFDYLTAGLALAFRPFSPDAAVALDRAGAWVSPLLAVLAGLALWLRGGRWRYAALGLFAVSPILVHGTTLGRPDHQSLIMFCAVAALAVEGKTPLTRARAVIGGLAWGLGVWVSLYEPLILLLLTCVLGAAAYRRAFFNRERLVWVGGIALVFLLGLAVDGWPIRRPDPAILAYFENWSHTVGELGRATPGSLVSWGGWLLFAAPLLLAWRLFRERDAEAGFWLGMLLALGVLTLWQARWGYFLAVGFALALPTVLETFQKRWLAWVILVVSLWPVAREWDRMLDTRQSSLSLERRYEAVQLRDVATRLRAERRVAILAPWWQSPALAYWSGQPCVAGSSHESLPGIVDSARFFESPGLTPAALEILDRRKVDCVVAYDGARVDRVSSAILGEPVPEESLARLLYERPHSVPAGLEPVYDNNIFRVFIRRPSGTP